MTRSPTAAERAGVDAERNRVAWNLPRQPTPEAPTASDRGSDALDWQAFSALYFPASGRHDMAAVTAYAAYRSSRRVPTDISSTARRARPSNGLAADLPASDRWEDDGGATR